MPKPIETADTVRVSGFPGRNGLAKKVLAGGGGATVLGAVIYYLLSSVSAQDARLQAVERKTEAVSEMKTDLRNLTRDMAEVKGSIRRIEGYIAGKRDQ